jgi:hypothetical protein
MNLIHHKILVIKSKTLPIRICLRLLILLVFEGSHTHSWYLIYNIGKLENLLGIIN